MQVSRILTRSPPSRAAPNLTIGAVVLVLVLVVAVFYLEISVEFGPRDRYSQRTLVTEPSDSEFDETDTASQASEDAVTDAAPPPKPARKTMKRAGRKGHPKQAEDAESETSSVVSATNILSSPFRVNDGALAVCVNFPRPKVAIVILGHPRSLYVPAVYRSIRANLIEAFGGDPVVFMTLNEPIANFDKVGDDKFPDRELNKEMYEDAIKALRPESLQWYKAPGPEEILNPRCSYRDKYGRTFRYISQVRSLEVAWPPVEEYEKKHNMQFDVVIRVRPDTVWTNGIPPYCMFPEDTIYCSHGTPPNWMPANDHAVIIPRKYAADFFNMISTYRECNGALPFDLDKAGYGEGWLQYRQIPHISEHGTGEGPFLSLYLMRPPGEHARNLDHCTSAYGINRAYFPSVDVCMKILHRDKDKVV